MADDTQLRITFSPAGRRGVWTVVVTQGTAVLHADEVSPARAQDRERFVGSLCERYPAIDPDVVRDLLLRHVNSDAPATADEAPRQSAILLELAAAVALFHTPEGEAYAAVPVDGRTETMPIKGEEFQEWLSYTYWVEHKRPPGSQALQDVVRVLCFRAKHEGAQAAVSVRVAEHAGAMFLDLRDGQGSVARVDRDGWRVVRDVPVRFVRRRGMLALPPPVQGGSLVELRDLVNADSDEHWVLMVAWLVAAMRPRGPYPILALDGEQGSAKSTTSRMLRGLIDPHQADLRPAPRDERDLVIAASNAWVLSFDNLSSIAPAMSDALCRLSTGGGFGTRALHTDDQEKLFSASRPLLSNGIGMMASRPDLLERSLVLTLPPISELARRSEAELWRQYEQIRPGILGALLDAVAAAIRNLADVRLSDRPRMADFVEWVEAAEPALPWRRGTFLHAYAANRDTANDAALDAAAVGPSIFSLLERTGSWSGTATDLLAALCSAPHGGPSLRQDMHWPRSANALSHSLRRLAPVFRRRGVHIEFSRDETRRRVRRVKLWVADE